MLTISNYQINQLFNIEKYPEKKKKRLQVESLLFFFINYTKEYHA